MTKTIQALIKGHFIKNLFLYIIIILSLTVGISTGAFTVNALSDSQTDELFTYIQDFFYILNAQDINNTELFKLSVFNNIKTLLILWFLGITIIGIPFILLIIGIKGFVIGFTVGFLIKSLNFKGIVFTFLGILPQNLIIIPCYIVLGITCINFSLSMIRNKVKTKYRKENIKTQFFSYSTFVILTF